MSITSFLVASVGLTLSPGPDILFVITESIANGRKAGIAIAWGLCTGLIVHTTAAALGIAALLSQSPTLFLVIQYAGAVYLLYLAYLTFRSRHKTNEMKGAESTHVKMFTLYKRGIWMNVLNPKVSLFFLAFLPQFVNGGAEGLSQSLHLFILGVLFIVQAIVIFSIVAIVAHKISTAFMRNPQASLITAWISTAIYTTIGFGLIVNILLK